MENTSKIITVVGAWRSLVARFLGGRGREFESRRSDQFVI